MATTPVMLAQLSSPKAVALSSRSMVLTIFISLVSTFRTAGLVQNGEMLSEGYYQIVKPMATNGVGFKYIGHKLTS